MTAFSDADRALLRNVPVLARLEAGAFEAALTAASIRHLNAGEVAVAEGDPGESFFVILDGTIAVYGSAPDGGEVQLASQGSGAWFGEQALMTSGGRRNATVRALGEARCAELPRSAFEAHVAPGNREVFDAAAAHGVRARLLASLDAFRGLPLDEMAEAVRKEAFEPSTPVFADGDESDAVYFVLSGTALAISPSHEGATELARIGPGQCFGEIGVLEGTPRTAAIVAASRLEVVRIEAGAFRSWHSSQPQLRDFLGTLQQTYSLADGQMLSVYRGEIDGRPSISTIRGDPAGDCVVSTKVLGEDTVILTRGRAAAEPEVTLTFTDADSGASRELQLADVDRRDDGRIKQARLVGVVARSIGADVGQLYEAVLKTREMSSTLIKRFERTGYLGGELAVGDGARICSCMQLGKPDILAAAKAHTPRFEVIRDVTGAGVICGSCRPAVTELLAASPGPRGAETPPTMSAPTALASCDAPLPLVVRRPMIEFDREAVVAISSTPTFQLLMLASVFASTGERFMMRRIEDAMSTVDDPELQAHVEAFLQQESNHITVHKPLNEIILRDCFPKCRPLQRLAEGLLWEDGMSGKLGLAVSAAFEATSDNFFAFFFNRYFDPESDGYQIFHSDPELEALGRRSGIADLFVWHGAEELAHRHVAFDVMKAKGTSYIVQVLGLVFLSLQAFVFFFPTLLMVRSKSIRPASAPNKVGLWGTLEKLWNVVPPFFNFLRPSFHPKNETYDFIDVLERDVDRLPR